MYDLIIIGGGAASQAAAMYAIGKQINFLMIYDVLGGRAGERYVMRTEEDVPVGQILVHFESVDEVEKEDHLVGSEAVHLFEKYIMEQQGHVLKDYVNSVAKNDTGFRVETVSNGVQQAKAVIIATGDRFPPLDVTGKEFLIEGLGYSSAAHAEMLQGKKAAVFGITERALHGTAELAHTTSMAYLVAPETIKSTPIVQALKMRSDVEILEGYKLKEAVGSNKQIQAIVVEKNGETRRLEVDVAFVAQALIPNSDMVKNLVETDAEGFIKVNERNATNVPGLFAAGEVSTTFGREILIAIGEGARAALSAHDYLLALPALKS
jgi:thioredoxin reductase